MLSSAWQHPRYPRTLLQSGSSSSSFQGSAGGFLTGYSPWHPYTFDTLHPQQLSSNKGHATFATHGHPPGENFYQRREMRFSIIPYRHPAHPFTIFSLLPIIPFSFSHTTHRSFSFLYPSHSPTIPSNAFQVSLSLSLKTLASTYSSPLVAALFFLHLHHPRLVDPPTFYETSICCFPRFDL